MEESRGNTPRRLEADDETVKYLLTLNDQLTSSGIDESDTDAVEALVNNVLEEIKSRAASLASDRRTSLVIEKLILIANLSQIVEFSKRFLTYSVFLSCNRYSSHVLQVSTFSF